MKTANPVSTPLYSDNLQEALQAQHRRGYGKLRFPPDMEAAFRRDLVGSGRKIRIVLFLLFAFTAANLPWVSSVLLGVPAVMSHYFHPIIYGQAPLMLAGAIAAWRVPLSKVVDALCIACYLVLSGAILSGRSMGVHYGFDVPLLWIGLATTVVLISIRLRFWHVLPWVVLVTAASVVNEAMFVVQKPDDYFAVITLILLTLVAAIGGYSLEYFMRQTWVNTRLLDHISSHDALTGLLNRKALHAQMQHVIAHARRARVGLAVAMIDIDYFKDYNDHYGHRAGDTVLHEVAKILQASTRRPHDLCGRYGGEEFIIVWTGGSREDRCELARSLCTRIEEAGLRHVHSRVANVVTVSIGVCLVEPDGTGAASGILTNDLEDTVVTLWEAADRPLYAAKMAGRNRVVCSAPQAMTRTA